MSLSLYQKKRSFSDTPEPEGKPKKRGTSLRFVIQKHDASQLHYDFRLELEGVLKSWAVPKGPSLRPADKRLAMMVEDHPIDYRSFEGVIPEGNYGAGTVIVWDEGTYEPEGMEGADAGAQEKLLLEQLEAGNLKIVLHGKKMNGLFTLFRLKKGGEDAWLLVKKKDAFAGTSDVTKQDTSVLSGRTLAEVAAAGGMPLKHEAEVPEEKGKKRTGTKAAKKTAPARTGPQKGSGKKGGKVEALLGASAHLAQPAPLPEGVKPMLATLVNEPFDHKDWLFEIKWDGYRSLAYVQEGAVELISRNEKPFTGRYRQVAEALQALKLNAVFDGEIVALNENGLAEFQLLQNWQNNPAGRLQYYLFDVLWLEGYDLTALPLTERKRVLKELLPANDPVLRFSDHVDEKGADFFEVALEQGLEGIMAKKGNSTYAVASRTDSWLKIKVNQRQEVVIAGFTQPRNSRKFFGALLLGVYEGDTLRYVGHTGSGFNRKSLGEIWKQLQALVTPDSPFRKTPKTNMPATWVKPELVCEIKFTEWTKDRMARHPIFVGLRTDKRPKAISLEKTASAGAIVAPEKDREGSGASKGAPAKKRLAVPEKRAPKAEEAREKEAAPEKAAVKKKATPEKAAAKKAAPKKAAPKQAAAKKEAAPKKKTATKKSLSGSAAALPAPDQADRPEGLIQLDTGAGKEQEVPVNGRLLKFTNLTKLYWKKEGGTKGELLNYYFRVAPYMLPYMIDRPQSLHRHPNGIEGQHFFQKNVKGKVPDWIPTHRDFSESTGQWVSYMLCQDEATLAYMANLGCIEMHPWHSRAQTPDRPDYCLIDLDPEDVPYQKVIECAHVIKDLLDTLGLPSYPKTSGSTGLHIYIPMGGEYSYDQSKQLAELLVRLVNSEIPRYTSIERSPSKRQKKVYLDYLQNRQAQTAAAPYSARPKPGLPVSTPLHWDEVTKGLTPDTWTMRNLFDRLKTEGDLFAPVLTGRIDLQDVLEKLASFTS